MNCWLGLLKLQLEKSSLLIQNSFEPSQRSQCCEHGWKLVCTAAPRGACSTTRVGPRLLESFATKFPSYFRIFFSIIWEKTILMWNKPLFPVISDTKTKGL